MQIFLKERMKVKMDMKKDEIWVIIGFLMQVKLFWRQYEWSIDDHTIDAI